VAVDCLKNIKINGSNRQKIQAHSFSGVVFIDLPFLAAKQYPFS
jgi:hypothetical protein